MCLITVGFNYRKDEIMLPSVGSVQIPNHSPLSLGPDITYGHAGMPLHLPKML